MNIAEENIKQHTEETPEKNKIIAWVKEHKSQLLFTGVSITTVILTIAGIKNKDALTNLWKSLKEQIEKGTLYSSKWFEKASLEELEKGREIVHKDFLNPKLDSEYRNECWNLLKCFDNAIEKIKWDGKEYEYPVHSSNGWYLTSDD